MAAKTSTRAGTLSDPEAAGMLAKAVVVVLLSLDL